MGAAADLKSALALWIAILVPPAAWAADETISYAFVKWSCGHQAPIVLHGITVVALGTIAAAAAIGWMTDAHNERERFMRTFGLLMSALFLFATIAIAMPKWAVDVCQ